MSGGRRGAAAHKAPESGPVRKASPTTSRLLALRVLERVEHGDAYADLVLNTALGASDLSQRDRALVTELVYGTLRMRGRIDFMLAAVSERKLDKIEPSVLNLLRLGAYQLLFSDRVPARAAVDQAVHCARASGLEHATGFVNAVLRGLARRAGQIEPPALETAPLQHLVHALSLPEWIAKRWLNELGPQGAAALAKASNQAPPLCARVNPLRATRHALLEELRTRRPGAAACRYAPDGIDLGHHGDPGDEPAFAEGRLTIQDEASQLVTALLDPKPGEHVLDLCAAPGGKATAMAERVVPGGVVTALDVNARRLELVERACRQLGLAHVHTRTLDARMPLGDLPGAPFQRVLVDAPCTGLGTLRRNPDLRWRIGPEGPAALAGVQAELLEQARRVVGAGGTLLYSTCTMTAEENEKVVEELLKKDPGLEVVRDAPAAVRPFMNEQGFMRTWPHLHGTDGFFAVRMVRRGGPA